MLIEKGVEKRGQIDGLLGSFNEREGCCGEFCPEERE